MSNFVYLSKIYGNPYINSPMGCHSAIHKLTNGLSLSDAKIDVNMLVSRQGS